MIFDSEIKFISVRKWLWLTKKGNITIQRWFVPSFTWFTSDIEVLVLMLIYLKLVKTMVGCFLTEVSEKILIKWEGIFSKEIVVLNKSVCWVCIVAISPSLSIGSINCKQWETDGNNFTFLHSRTPFFTYPQASTMRTNRLRMLLGQ